MSLRSALSAFAFLALALLPRQAHAQQATPHATQFWLSGGAGIGFADKVNSFPVDAGGATTVGFTVQHHALVTSLRWARSTGDGTSSWFAGGLVGVGSPARYALRGSIAAGLGVAGTRGTTSDMTVPVEVQLGIRLTPVVGFGVTGFGAVTGKNQSLGATFGLQLGRLW